MKTHLTALDGLRGVAALLVVAHHLEEQMGSYGLFYRGFLAVDFFFVLSGFVIGLAYENRLESGMALASFARVRIIRLYPMLATGAVIGAVAALIMGVHLNLFVALPAHLLLIPAISGGGLLFALNPAFWSLMLELGANITHAITFRWLSTRLLAVLVAGAAVLIGLTAWKMTNLGGGWGPTNAWVGIPRVAFSYGAGLLLYRFHAAGKLNTPALPFPVLAGLLCAAILGGSFARHWIYDVVAATVLFPAIVALGASSTVGREIKAAMWLGLISYPIYAVHNPLVLLWGQYAPHTTLSAAVALAGLSALATAAAAFDKRARAWLSSAFVQRSAAA